MTTPILSPAEQDYILQGLSHPTTPTRLDGRPLLSHRPIVVSYGEAPQASGSSRVTLGGGTEVIAGIRLEVGDDVAGGGEKGKEGWRGRVEVDVTPQAYPHLTSSALSTISTQYANIIAEHFVPSIPPIPILPPTKYFIPHLHLTLLSATSGSPLTALVIAARAAFLDLRIPSTKRIGWESTTVEVDGGEGTGTGVKESDLSGIKAAVRAGRTGGKGKGKAAVRGEDWDLDMSTAGGRGVGFMDGREGLPVLVTLNLIPGTEAIFLDSTPSEDAACPDKLHCFFTGSGKVCGLRMEGNSGIDADRIRPLLLEGQRIAAELVESLNKDIPRHP